MLELLKSIANLNDLNKLHRFCVKIQCGNADFRNSDHGKALDTWIEAECVILQGNARNAWLKQ